MLKLSNKGIDPTGNKTALVLFLPFWPGGSCTALGTREMKRDFDLIRKLLFFFEKKEDSGVIEKPEVDGYSEQEISYHCRLLHDAGFLRCEPIKSSTSDRVIGVLPFELTWAGHEFLDQIRADSTWNHIKSYSKEKGVALSFNIVSELAKKLLLSVIAGA